MEKQHCLIIVDRAQVGVLNVDDPVNFKIRILQSGESFAELLSFLEIALVKLTDGLVVCDTQRIKC